MNRRERTITERFSTKTHPFSNPITFVRRNLNVQSRPINSYSPQLKHNIKCHLVLFERKWRKWVRPKRWKEKEEDDVEFTCWIYWNGSSRDWRPRFTHWNSKTSCEESWRQKTNQVRGERCIFSSFLLVKIVWFWRIHLMQS